MLPSNARRRRLAVEKRLNQLAQYSEKSPLNFIEHHGNRKLGIVTSGIAYQYVREAIPKASVLKLGLTNPLPRKLIRRFWGEVERMVVVEELDPFLEEQLQTWRLVAVLKETGQSAKVRMQHGYDHSYYFIASFIDDHLRHHARILNAL